MYGSPRKRIVLSMPHDVTDIYRLTLYFRRVLAPSQPPHLQEASRIIHPTGLIMVSRAGDPSGDTRLNSTAVRGVSAPNACIPPAQIMHHRHLRPALRTT